MSGSLSAYSAVLGCCALLAGAATSQAGGRVPTGGVIAFSSNRDGDTEIYVMKPDGSSVRRLTHSPQVRLAGQLVARRPQAPLLQPALARWERLGHERGRQRATTAHPGLRARWPGQLVAGRHADRLRQRPRRRERHLRHEGRRQRRAEADRRPCQRPESAVVARRKDDRLCERARRRHPRSSS